MIRRDIQIFCALIRRVPPHDEATVGDDERDLRSAWEAGDFQAVAKLTLERYGPEILGVLAARLSSISDAAEVFSVFAEDLWRGIPGFQWRCRLRAWAHRIARNAATRWGTAGDRRPERNVPLEHSSVLEIADQVRSSTLVYLRTDMKSEVRRLREELSELDQTLIILRIDKQMEWHDIAAAVADDDLIGDELRREAARLRKRFQLATDKLRELARERGILDR
jgi:RNA polymerase sigma-70 factor (ECF subfamily)